MKELDKWLKILRGEMKAWQSKVIQERVKDIDLIENLQHVKGDLVLFKNSSDFRCTLSSILHEKQVG